MRNDVVIGVTISGLIHAGAFFGGYLFPTRPVPPPPPPPKAVIKLMEMPKIEPEEPEKVEVSNEPVKPMDFAPPMQTDTPQVVTDTSFVQPIQPPPPDNVKLATGIVNIPENRDTKAFQNITVFDPSSLDQRPQARVQTPPTYPFEMKRQGIVGQVVVDFIVDPNGTVQNAYALSSTNREFEQPAVQAVSKWRFKPGMKAGRAVHTHMQIPIQFKLEDGE